MCGILGSVNIPFDNQVLDMIKHRGPDDSGIEQFEVNGHEICLGQRRLAIIDLSAAGHQPMISECADYVINFNGEIYNHQDLRAKLPSDINFKGHSDTETILYYLKHFGIEGIRDLNGIFSIFYLDRKANKLFLARDPFGVKPLYFYEGDDNTMVFSSEIRPIKKIAGETALDRESLATLLRLRYNPSPDTLHDRIEKVRPGHYLEITLGNNKLEKTQHPYLGEIPATINYPSDKVVKLYGEKLEKAVERQLLSDVEVGVLLSGGIDSALVAALAQKHSKTRLKAFTIGFEGEHAEDEIADAAETAEVLGLDHYYKKISFVDFLNTIKECTRIVEEPLATTSMVPMLFLSELASSHVKVVLTGQGADEPLGGYTRYKLELARNKVPSFIRAALLPVVRTIKVKSEKVLRGVNAIGIKDEINRFLSVYEVFSMAEIEKLISVTDRRSFERIAYFYDLLKCKSKKDSVERMMALDSRLNLSDDLLNYTDKITMNFSMECRVPMLDLELIAFIESLSVQYKLNLKTGKITHKQFAKEILPDKIIHRKKKGFLSPTNYWFRKESDSIKGILLKGQTVFSNVFNQQYISDIIAQHHQGYNKEKQIFLLLSIYFWLEYNMVYENV